MEKSTKLLVCLGPGGVGKTTCSAAIAAAYAAQGKRAVVMTVDPARRLAQALGLKKLDNNASLISGSESKGGSLEALWLSSDGALELLARKYAPDKESLAKMLAHPFFRIIESQLGGIEEYLGIEKALELINSGNYDVCVLDTPPSQHAIDFFESPQDLLTFFDQGILKYFLPNEAAQGPWYKRAINLGRNRALELFQNLLGKSFFGELGTLLKLLDPLHSALQITAREAQQLLASDRSHFILVGAPETYPIEELKTLNHALELRQLSPRRSWIANKCYPDLDLVDIDSLKKILGPCRFEWVDFCLREQKKALEKAHFGAPLPKSHAKLLRHSVKHLSLEALQEMGEGILEQCKI